MSSSLYKPTSIPFHTQKPDDYRHDRRSRKPAHWEMSRSRSKIIRYRKYRPLRLYPIGRGTNHGVEQRALRFCPIPVVGSRFKDLNIFLGGTVFAGYQISLHQTLHQTRLHATLRANTPTKAKRCAAFTCPTCQATSLASINPIRLFGSCGIKPSTPI